MAVPSHWIYDQAALASKVSGAESGPEFLTPWGNTFYELEVGALSCYGDQHLILLQSLVEDKGLVPAKYCQRLVDGLGPDSPYGAHPQDKSVKPIKSPWRHGSVCKFLDNLAAGKAWPDCGGDDAQVDGLAKTPSVVAMLASQPHAMLKTADAAIRVTQNNDVAVAYGLAAARIIASLVTGATSSPVGAIKACADALEDEARLHPTALDGQIAEDLKDALELAAREPDHKKAAMSLHQT